MKRYQVHIFATNADLVALIQKIESKRELQYLKAGLFDAPDLNGRPSLLNDASLGAALIGDNAQEIRYLVADRDVRIEVRPVPQHSGGTKYAIDQKVNPKTIVFRPGGVFNKMAVISGDAETISEDPKSLALFQLFSKEIKSQFDKIKSYYVGKAAAQLLGKGWRLTSSVTSPSLYDLTK